MTLAGVVVLFVFGIQFKRNLDRLENVRRWSQLYGNFLEDVRARLDMSSRVMMAGHEDGYRFGLARSRDRQDGLDALIEKLPAFPEPYRLRAEMFRIQGEYDRAEADLQRYADLRPPMYGIVHLERALIAALRYMNLLLLGAAPSEVEGIARRGQEEAEAFQEWWASLTRSNWSSLDAEQRSQVERELFEYPRWRLVLSIKRFLQGKFEASRNDWFAYRTQDDPWFPPAYAFEALSALEAGNPDAAESAVTEALKLSPGHPWFHTLAALVHLARGEGKPAREQCDAALKFEGDYAPALYVRARALLRLGEIDECLRATQDLETRSDAAALPKYGLSLLRAEALSARAARDPNPRAWDDAIQAYSRSIAFFPTSPEAHLSRYRVQLQAGRVADAERDLDFVVSAEPLYLPGRNERLRLLLQRGDLEAVRKELEILAKLLAQYSRVRHEGRIGELVKTLDEILAKEQSVDGVIARARANVLRERWKEAEADFSAAIAARPKDLEILLDRIEARIRIGDRAGALADLDRAENLNGELNAHKGEEIERQRRLAQALPRQR